MANTTRAATKNKAESITPPSPKTDKEETHAAAPKKTETAVKASEKNTVPDTEQIIAALLSDDALKAKLIKALGASEKQTNDDVVEIICLCDIAQGITIPLGPPDNKLGEFTEFGQSIEVSLKDFRSKLRDARMQYLFKTRRLIIGEGLTDDIRRRYPDEFNYADGENLTREAYNGLLDLEPDKLAELFGKLSQFHKETVAGKFAAALAPEGDGVSDNRVTRAKLVAMNKKTKSIGGKRMFDTLIAQFGTAE